MLAKRLQSGRFCGTGSTRRVAVGAERRAARTPQPCRQERRTWKTGQGVRANERDPVEAETPGHGERAEAASPARSSARGAVSSCACSFG
jgi:hypothetical protein